MAGTHRPSTTHIAALPLRRPLVAAALFVAAAVAACSDSSAPALPVVADVVVTGLPDTVGVGDTLRLDAQPRDAGGTTLRGIATRWRSLSPSIATIDSSGLLRALVTGEATLVVAAAGRRLHEDTVVAVVRRLPRRFAFSPVPDSLFVGVVDTLQVEVLDGDGRPLGTIPSWSSSDTGVVTVDSIGVVRAYNLGVAWVRASAGGRSDSVRVRADYREVLPRRDWIGLSLGSQDYRYCAITSAGETWCLRVSRTDLVQVPGSVSLRSIETGQTQACGLAADSTMYCWGANGSAEFGRGTRLPSRSDSLMQGGLGMKWRAIALGYHRAACGILAADSVVYCWGHNDFLQTGKAPRNPTDSLVAPFATPLKVKSVDLSFLHGCAISLDDALWCWGSDASAYQEAANVAGTPVQVAPPGSYVALTTPYDATCGLDARGVAWCWGRGTSSSTDVPQWTPRRVTTSARFTRVMSGPVSDACGLTATGELHCWSLHPSPRTPAFTATHVMPGRSFVTGEYGSHGWCALSTAGRLYCR